jgi:hypothetical protein
MKKVSAWIEKRGMPDYGYDDFGNKVNPNEKRRSMVPYIMLAVVLMALRRLLF